MNGRPTMSAPMPLPGELVFRRFFRLLTTRWWIPLAFAVVLAGALGLTATTHYSVTQSVNSVNKSSLMQSVGFDPEVLSQGLPLNVDIATVTGSEFADAVSAQVGQSITASVTPSASPDTSVATVTIDSGNSAASVAALDIYVKAIEKSRATRLASLIDTLTSDQKSTKADLDGRLAALDTQLAGISDPTGSLASALLADRVRIADELTSVSRAITALATVRDRPAEVLSLTGDRDVVESSGRLVKVVAGGSFGVLLGGGLLLGMAFFDRRSRSREDIRFASACATIMVLAKQPTAAETEVCARLVASLARRASVTTVNLLPFDDDATTAADVSRLIAAVPEADEGLTLGLFSCMPGDASFISADGISIAVVRYGVTRTDDLARVRSDLEVADRSFSAVLLLGVPRNDLGWVSRTPPISREGA